MNPKRLPLPNEVVEHCRLCAAVLEISAENPRRVCPHCGEVNFPTDGVAVQPAPPVSPWAAPSLQGVLSGPSRAKWLTHGVALSVQLVLVLLVAFSMGSGGKFDLGLVFVGIAFVGFGAYALVMSVPVAFMKTTRQVLLFDCMAPVLTLIALWLSMFVPHAR